MLYCLPNETFSAHWVDHGLSHCFLETLTSLVPLIFLAPSALAQWLYYRKYAAPSEDYQRPRNCSFSVQVVLHVVLGVLALLRPLLQYVWSAPPGQLFGYQLVTALASCLCWQLSVVLVMLERRRMLPSSPCRGHGLPLLVGWALLFAAQFSILVNFRSAAWWFMPKTHADISELVLFTIRLTASCLVFILGLRAPGMARVEHFIPYMIHNPRLSESDQPSSGRTAGSGSTWRGAVRKLRRLLPFLWPRNSVLLQLCVLVCFALLLVSRAVNVFVPIYSKLIVNDLSLPGSSLPWLDIGVLVVLKLLMGGGVGTMGLLNNVRSLIWIKVQQYTEREIQVELFAHLHRLSLSWHLSRKTGEVLRVMDRGTTSINTLLSYLFFQIVPTFIDIAVAVAFFSSQFNAWFGLIVFVTMLLYLLATIGITEWRTKYRRLSNLLDNDQRAKGVDSLLNFETVKYYDAEQYEVQRYRDAVVERQKADWTSQASLNLLNCVQSFVISGGLFVGSVLCAHLVLDVKSLTVGDYVLFATYMVQLYAPLNWFGTYYRMIQQNFIDMENMLDLLQERQEVCDNPGAPGLRAEDGRLELRGVCFHYQPERPVLQDVSFAVDPGQTVALVGPSGSGKSTIVRLLFRLYDPCKGEILLDGQNIRLLRQSSVRRAIGVVPQDTVLFNDTIGYNIRYGRRDACEDEVKSAAQAADLHRRIVTFPDQYNTQVGERGLKLSGGEKQRVAIARTLLKAPTFILLDEATSALDTETERNIQSSLGHVCTGRTTLIVAHRLSTIVHADLILVLKDGCIVERGRHGELMDFGGVYSGMWRQQSEAERKRSLAPLGSSEENSLDGPSADIGSTEPAGSRGARGTGAASDSAVAYTGGTQPSVDGTEVCVPPLIGAEGSVPSVGVNQGTATVGGTEGSVPALSGTQGADFAGGTHSYGKTSENA